LLLGFLLQDISHVLAELSKSRSAYVDFTVKGDKTLQQETDNLRH
jgi:hypothetical protein